MTESCSIDSDLVPAHRSHDPAKNLKRSDPFRFGSRYLEEGDDVFEYNAWDHVTPDDAFYAHAEQQYALQRENPVSQFDQKRFNGEPEKWWDKFYSNNANNFFKNRKWLAQEFPILHDLTKPSAGPITILEIGAGAGNTAYPILAANKNEQLMIYACDFSKKAVDLIKHNEAYDETKIKAEVWDVSADRLPSGLEPSSVDAVFMIFTFSALSPQQWGQAVVNIWTALKPGGEVCFRDYGKGDLAQVRFKKGRYLEENFYVRGDGTRVYFFELEELRRTWTQPIKYGLKGAQSEASISDEGDSAACGDTNRATFEVLNLAVDRRMLVNRQRQLKMHRCWLQAHFRKPQKVDNHD